MATTKPFPHAKPHNSIGQWLPKDRRRIQAWVAGRLKELRSRKTRAELAPSIAALRDLVNEDEILKPLSQAMFDQVPPGYPNDDSGESKIDNFTELLDLINLVLKAGPQWSVDEQSGAPPGLIGFPINAVLDYPMGTLAGYSFFRYTDVNQKFHAILATWGAFLASPESVACLDPDNGGWLSESALKALSEKGSNGAEHPIPFDVLYECNPTMKNFGFTSWDDFFTRKFRIGMRPVECPDGKPSQVEGFENSSFIVNGCESKALQYVQNVQLYDKFWLKEQPYSLADMLDNDLYTHHFVGGSVYQAFLSALSYHCWNAPVSGTVLKTRIIPGTYYTENINMGFGTTENPNDNPDPYADDQSQPYISAVATRAVIFIQADNPQIGLMAIVYIGMAEVSSCTFSVAPGDRLVKGITEVGAFHFGGSTHCMIFRPSVKLKFSEPPTGADGIHWDEDNPGHNFALGRVLAMVEK